MIIGIISFTSVFYEMISVEQIERMIAEAVQQAVAQAVAQVIAPLLDALMQAQRTIAALQTKLYGVRTETSQEVLTAEGQPYLDATWGQSQETTPLPAAPVEEPATTVRA